ncbi:hypothetical protein AABB24_013472 [Solanum stoloniferum]|uniref:Protein kinase domain-containing protein n=1 Tax=Solanum stoloniferum TaxID=62892 RepID=A0ABD2U8H0_9SOLN
MTDMVKQYIGLSQVVKVKHMKRLTTCTDDGYVDYIRNQDLFHLGNAGMAEQCIGLPDSVVIEKMNRLTTCTDNGYVDYICNRDPLHLGLQDVELLKLVRLLLKADPNQRIEVDESLRHLYFGDSRPTSTIGMTELCIELSQLVKIKQMKKLATCTEYVLADYVHSRDTFGLRFHGVELLKLVRLLMSIDPDLRIGVDEALQHSYFVGFRYTDMYSYFTFLTFVVLLGSIWYGLKGAG